MAKIILVGTSHISPESLKNVRNVIVKEKPDCVAVELDPIRYKALISGEGGISLRYGMFNFLLSIVQKKLGEKTGVIPGSEMLDAIKAAKEVNAKIVLIDEDIRITLLKLKRVKFAEKIKLLFSLFYMPKLMNLNISDVPSKKLIRSVLRVLKKEFPNIYRVLVLERNKYMFNWIKKLSAECKKIVVVVGAGHVEGLKRMVKRL